MQKGYAEIPYAACAFHINIIASLDKKAVRSRKALLV